MMPLSYFGGAMLTAPPSCPDLVEHDDDTLGPRGEGWQHEAAIGDEIKRTPGAALDRASGDMPPLAYRDDAIAASARRLLGLPHPLGGPHG